MEQQTPLIPLCRLYQNESQRTGKPYLVGNLTFTTKLVGFQTQDEQGNTCWQLYLQERLAKSAADQRERATPAPPEEKLPWKTEQPAAGEVGGSAGGDSPTRRIT